MGGSKSRDKGKRGELEVCKLIHEGLGLKVNRLLKQYQQAQLGDIEQLIGPYLIEVKNCAALDLKSWWGQAERAASAHPEAPQPCLAYKVPRKGWRFRVPLPQAWASGHQWGRELQYTMDLSPDGFFLIVREHMGA